MRVLPDMTVAAFTLVLCLIATLVTGLVPALRGTRDAADFSAARRGPFATRRAVLRTVLLGAQVTLSATLLFGATLLTRGLLHAWNIDPGYSLHTVSVVRVTLPAQAYDAARVRRSSARSCATRSPRRTSDRWEWRTRCRWSRHASSHRSVVRRMPPPTRGDVHLRSYSPELFTLLKLPVVAGVMFDDRQTGEVVVNESMARAFWPDSPAVGQRLDRWLANRGSGRRRPRRADDRSRRGRAGDVHAEDVRARCRHS